jgi:hypothetical protein
MELGNLKGAREDIDKVSQLQPGAADALLDEVRRREDGNDSTTDAPKSRT